MDIIAAQRWAYIPELPPDIGPVRDLLRTYSNIPGEEIDRHILRVREEAWSFSRHPCVGRWRFLRLHDDEDACYQQVVFRLRVPGSRDVFLDLGCCVGQILRQLRAAGVEGSRLIGTDVQPRFIEVGYNLFRDRDRLGASFVIGDMLDQDDRRLDELHGRVTIIYAGSFFHLFTWSQQLYIGRRLVAFLKPGTRNALLYGRQAGTSQSGTAGRIDTASPFLHNKSTFQQLWDEIGLMTKTRWRVDFETVSQTVAGSYCGPIAESDPQCVHFIVYQVS